MIAGIAHVNITVPEGTLDLANEFYASILGLTPRPVPALQKGSLAWFDIGSSGQQIHVAFGSNVDLESTRHPCFKLQDKEALAALQLKIWEHFEAGGSAAPMAADKPGQLDSGAQGVEYPDRFFARDYAGNRLEFSL
ncbi:hypothetical protein BGZ61DRAFT_480911 [Ilyonectria robusta]|uniref:uncharacterized protein n=1 Tax=Ilyonectria robusta TaxID=1079257 RepID=UPI001E8EB1F9|nr:uncharacterized protein BGZ61DRAFT_480911 [Ilyonectria robusta]KAH8680212.1 hypothetical protein BGZ61DRAFT_480911 [Ilyonectria robusta]